MLPAKVPRCLTQASASSVCSRTAAGLDDLTALERQVEAQGQAIRKMVSNLPLDARGVPVILHPSDYQIVNGTQVSIPEFRQRRQQRRAQINNRSQVTVLPFDELMDVGAFAWAQDEGDEETGSRITLLWTARGPRAAGLCLAHGGERIYLAAPPDYRGVAL